MWGAASILFCCARCSGTLVWARRSRSGRRSPHRVAVPSGGGGGGASPRLRGGGGPRLWLPSWGGCGLGGGVGGPPFRPLSGLSGRGGGSGGGPLVP